MTNRGKDAWTYEDLERMLEAVSVIGAEDADDPKVRKQRRILDAATQLFLRHGYRRASVEEIARTAGVAKGTVYLYFPTKADLLIQALLEERKGSMEKFKSAFEPKSGKERLRRWLELVLEGFREQPLTARVMQGDRELSLVLEELDADLVEQSFEMKIAFLVWLLREAIPGHALSEEELRDRARMLLCTFRSVPLVPGDERLFGFDPRRYGEQLIDALIDGVTTETSRTRERVTPVVGK